MPHICVLALTLRTENIGEANKLSSSYAMISEFYRGQRLTPDKIRRLDEKEVVIKFVRIVFTWESGNYLLWQMLLIVHNILHISSYSTPISTSTVFI